MEEEIIERIEAILSNHERVISELNFITDTFLGTKEKYAQLAEIVDTIQNINLSENVDNIIEKLEEYGQLVSELNLNLGKNLNLFNLIKTNQNSNIDIDNYKVNVYDSKFDLVNIPATIDPERKKLNLTSRLFTEELYYIQITQNMENTKLFINNAFTFYKVESINNNTTKLILNVDDESIIQDIVNDNKLNDSVVYINGESKYHVTRYGGVIINQSKKLVLTIFPNIIGDINTVSFHQNLFDDVMMELNFSDFNMQDVSDFYFGDAERDLSSGEMIIFGKGREPRHTYTFSIEGNKELRKRNA